MCIHRRFVSDYAEALQLPGFDHRHTSMHTLHNSPATLQPVGTRIPHTKHHICGQEYSLSVMTYILWHNCSWQQVKSCLQATAKHSQVTGLTPKYEHARSQVENLSLQPEQWNSSLCQPVPFAVHGIAYKKLCCIKLCKTGGVGNSIYKYYLHLLWAIPVFWGCIDICNRQCYLHHQTTSHYGMTRGLYSVVHHTSHCSSSLQITLYQTEDITWDNTEILLCLHSVHGQ